MTESPYPTFKQTFGTLKSQFNERFDPRLIAAIKQYQAWHKAQFGFEPSRSDIFSTSVLQQNDKIRGYYNDIVRKEKQSGRKYLDGIKRDHPIWGEDFNNI
jgi:membrane-bound lytic murein transglycosylase